MMRNTLADDIEKTDDEFGKNDNEIEKDDFEIVKNEFDMVEDEFEMVEDGFEMVEEEFQMVEEVFQMNEAQSDPVEMKWLLRSSQEELARLAGSSSFGSVLVDYLIFLT